MESGGGHSADLTQFHREDSFKGYRVSYDRRRRRVISRSWHNKIEIAL